MSMTQQVAKPQPIKEMAARVVKECLQVKPDEQITIFTWDHTIDYAREFALEVEKASGVSTMLLESNDHYWSYLREVPESQFARLQKGFLSLLDQTDAMIQLAGPKDPSPYTSLPDGRAMKMINGAQAIADKMNERKIRVMNIPIGLVTPERAK